MKFNEAHFFAAAFVLHLALPVAAYIAPSDTGGPLALLPRSQPQEFDVDVDNLPPPPRPVDENLPIDPQNLPSGDADPDTAQAPAAPPRSLVPPKPGADADPNDGAADPNAVLTAPDGAGDNGNTVPDEYGYAPSASDVDGPGGPGTGPLWARPGMVPGEGTGRPGAPTRTPQRKHDPHAGTKALREAMLKEDRKLGLDLPAVGAIAGVIRDAVRASETPYECTASLTVTLSGSGNVTSVSLNSFSGGSPGVWQTVRRTVLAQLKARSFLMKSAYAKGAIIGYGINSAKKSPGGGTGRDGLTLKFDVADIGARATRSVRVGGSARAVQ